jgi:hypothetical protein
MLVAIFSNMGVISTADYCKQILLQFPAGYLLGILLLQVCGCYILPLESVMNDRNFGKYAKSNVSVQLVKFPCTQVDACAFVETV